MVLFASRELPFLPLHCVVAQTALKSFPELFNLGNFQFSYLISPSSNPFENELQEEDEAKTGNSLWTRQNITRQQNHPAAILLIPRSSIFSPSKPVVSSKTLEAKVPIMPNPHWVSPGGFELLQTYLFQGCLMLIPPFQPPYPR